MDPVERDLLAVNAAFYEAFRDRNITAMTALWARSAPVACLHPGMAPIVGREEVLRSYRGILAHPEAPVIHCTGERAHILGTSAFVTCLEGRPGKTPRLVATNIFTLEEGRWRLVHHQAAPLSPQTTRASKPPPPPGTDDPQKLN